MGESANTEVQRLALRTGDLGTGREMRTGGGLRTAPDPLPAVVMRGIVSHLKYNHNLLCMHGIKYESGALARSVL